MYTFYTKNLDIPNRYIPKILLIMRLTTILIIASMLQVSAAGFAQKLNYQRKQTTLLQLFNEIKTQTGYNVVWPEQDINTSTLITANFKNTPIKTVLDQSLKGLNLSYLINNKTIIIKAAAPSLLDKALSVIQDFTKQMDVRGRVLDDQNQPLAGAVIKVKGTNKATSTNSNGDFELKNIPEDATLTISYLGFETKEVKATENLGSIVLTLNTGKLQEVEINAGYYTVKERALTGSISRVDASTIAQQPVSNPLMALQNRVPGLEITQLTGMPGAGFRVQIRGRGSINSGTDPLYIVDGVTYPSARLNTAFSNTVIENASPLSLINPNDIESIEVLKDADATAIYGSRGANGVILISTKKGTEGATTLSANISHGIGQVGHKMALMDTEQYLAMRTEAFKNDKLSPAATDYDVNGTWDKNKYTDWQDLLIGGSAQFTEASLNVSGGNKNSNYLISGNYRQEGTVFPGDFGFKRGGIHTAINFGQPKSPFQANLSLSYNRTASNLTTADPTTNTLLPPNYPDVYDQYGKFNWSYNNAPMLVNPMADLQKTGDTNTDMLVGNLSLSYRILSNLIVKASIGYNTIKREELAKIPLIALAPANNPTSTNRISRFGNNYNNSWITEPQLNYNTKLGSGKIDALAGMSFQKNEAAYRNIRATNFNSDELMDNISSAAAFSVDESSYTTYKYAAVFGRINYSLQDRYFINLTARRDASSRFGPGKQFANFGAIGAAWIFSDEAFAKQNLAFLSFGKLRASYGLTGNDQIDDFRYLQLLESGPSYLNTSTLTITRPANPEYAWETNRKMEFVLQLGFLDDKLNVEVAHFINRSSNQLVNYPLPPSVGSATILANLPATVQNTGWELESNIKLLNGKNLGWQIGFNLSIPKNKLTAYPGLANSTNASRYIIGKALGIRRYYHTWVDAQSGLYVHEDVDGSGTQSNADLVGNTFLGQLYYGGLQNTIRYKQFNLDFLFSFTKQNGNSLLNGIGYSAGYFANGGTTNQPLAVLSRWQNPGDQATVLKFSTTTAAFSNSSLGETLGNQSVADNSFIRLKNVNLSYSLPKKWLSRFKLKGLALNVQGQNLWTITSYEGFDPENLNPNRLPPLRILAMGLKLTL